MKDRIYTYDEFYLGILTLAKMYAKMRIKIREECKVERIMYEDRNWVKSWLISITVCRKIRYS